MKQLIKHHWEFDSSVAGRFQQEAEQHIPDYHKVITLSLTYSKQFFPLTANVIDVGSALGHTVKTFVGNGFNNTTGVEKSDDMISKSEHKDRIIHSDSLPSGPWDIVLANWTLHFVNERQAYLQKMYDELTPRGMLILSDKMSSSDDIQTLYHNFKRRNGVTDETISKKAEALKGVLVTKPLQWYLTTLEDIGFTDIQVINASYMFNTIYCRK